MTSLFIRAVSIITLMYFAMPVYHIVFNVKAWLTYFFWYDLEVEFIATEHCRAPSPPSRSACLQGFSPAAMPCWRVLWAIKSSNITWLLRAYLILAGDFLFSVGKIKLHFYKLYFGFAWACWCLYWRQYFSVYQLLEITSCCTQVLPAEFS